MRVLSKRCVLWTEMVVDETLYFNRTDESDGGSCEQQRLLDRANNSNHPVVACQIGGICPVWTAAAARLVTAASYCTEINLNLDCPSNRVQGKHFGAVLMKQPDIGIKLLKSKRPRENTCCVGGKIPISVKCQIGMDDDAGTYFAWLVDPIQRLSKVCHRLPLLDQRWLCRSQSRQKHCVSHNSASGSSFGRRHNYETALNDFYYQYRQQRMNRILVIQ